MFKANDWIFLEDEKSFNKNHDTNISISAKIRGRPVKVECVDKDGDIRSISTEGGTFIEFPITKREQQYFRLYKNTISHGCFKIIFTYIEDGKTIEEDGVTFVSIDHNTIEYKYNRKKLGFVKYSGEVKLYINELKQITISTPENERVFHIEKGVIVREHIMYDEERKFKLFEIGD